jgi:two-component system, NtrC family, response regulator AtoC
MSSRLLVVDDEKNIAFALCAYFSRLGFEVDCATTSEEATAMLERGGYELLILDVQLSGAGSREGLAIAREARERFPALSILVLTAFGTPEVEHEARAAGADDFLTKPARLGELERLAATAMAQRSGSVRSGI